MQVEEPMITTNDNIEELTEEQIAELERQKEEKLAEEISKERNKEITRQRNKLRKLFPDINFKKDTNTLLANLIDEASFMYVTLKHLKEVINKNGVKEKYLNGNNQFDGDSDWTCGDWMAWVGTYDDLMLQNDGEYCFTIAEDFANSAKSGDTGYAGVVVLDDGTFIMDSYGHWDEDFSSQWNGGVYSLEVQYP